jgi:hypothetical protein
LLNIKQRIEKQTCRFSMTATANATDIHFLCCHALFYESHDFCQAPNAAKIPKALYQGELKIGGMVIPCANLDTGERVISERALAIALGVRGGGAYWQRKKKGDSGALLPESVSASYLQPFITDSIKEKFSESITYRAKQGGMATGNRADVLPEYCDIWIRAKESGALDKPNVPETAKGAAERAYILLKAFAVVGINALVDEATGFQDVRDREALQEILRKYITGALFEWTKTFPMEFYKEIFRLNGWPWNGGKMPGVVGTWTNDLVYDRLAPDLLAELKRVNPVNEKGYRSNRHHQYLTRDIGHPELQRRLYELIGMARPFNTGDWDRYCRLVDRTFPKLNTTMALQLGD